METPPVTNRIMDINWIRVLYNQAGLYFKMGEQSLSFRIPTKVAANTSQKGRSYLRMMLTNPVDLCVYVFIFCQAITMQIQHVDVWTTLAPLHRRTGSCSRLGCVGGGILCFFTQAESTAGCGTGHSGAKTGPLKHALGLDSHHWIAILATAKHSIKSLGNLNWVAMEQSTAWRIY